jgi:hypothetical protein
VRQPSKDPFGLSYTKGWTRRDVVWYPTPAYECRDTQHLTWRMKRGGLFNGDQVVGR